MLTTQIYYFEIFFNLFGSNELIEDNKAILWLFGWANCVEIMGTDDGGGGGGGGVVVKDDEWTATIIKSKQNRISILSIQFV